MFKPHPQATAIIKAQCDAASAQAQYSGSAVPASVSPQADYDLASIGAVVRGPGPIDYKPAAPWSNVPGVGVANLAYIPDFMISPLESFSGATTELVLHALVETQKPFVVSGIAQTIEGLGGQITGTLAMQQLVEVSYNTGTGGD